MLVKLELALIVTAAYWGLAHLWNAASSRGTNSSSGIWNALTDITAFFVFGAIVLMLQWKDISRAGNSGFGAWAVGLAPFPPYYFLNWRFARWRWRHFRQSEKFTLPIVTFKPNTPVAWVVYIWFGVWVAWQLCHALAPALLPHWLT